MAASFDTDTRGAPRPGAPGLDEVRGRVDHVVVLMLENRSFDHLLGFAGLPGADGLDPGEHPNPVDATDPARGTETPSPTAGHLLAVDPPHSHQSAKQQLGALVGGRHRMDGFVDAYRLKLLHRDHFPEVRWARLTAMAAGLGALLGSAAGEVVRRATTDDGWSGLAAWAVAAAVATALLVALRPLGRAADLATWKLVGGVAAVSVALTLGVVGLLAHVRDPRPATVAWLGGGAAVGVAGVAFARRVVARLRTAGPGAEDEAAVAARRIMRCLPPDRVRVLGQLAREFATCHRWFSSVPGATWPNRNFLHAGTSSQSVDIEVGLYDDPTLFDLLDDQAAAHPGTLTDPPWRIYRDGMPQVMAFRNLWRDDRRGRWRSIDRFVADCAAGDLPTYSFVEPRHSGGATNSLHPTNNERPSGGSSDFARGEELVRRVYTALRDAPGGLFDRTVLVVTFDEHGGLFDHVSPPRTVHPAPLPALRHPVTTVRRLVAWFVEHRNAPFDFRRLGVRVPTLVISPLVEPGTADRAVYDHTSVIATVRDLFAPDRPPLALGRRARDARPFWDLLTRSTPRPTPEVPPPGYEPEVAVGEEALTPAGVEAVEAVADDGRAVSQDGEIAAQLAALAAQADALLTERGAPEVVVPEGDPALSLPDRVDTRLALWSDD